MRGGSLAAGEPTGRYTSATHSILAAIQSLWVLFLEQAAAFLCSPMTVLCLWPFSFFASCHVLGARSGAWC